MAVMHLGRPLDAQPRARRIAELAEQATRISIETLKGKRDRPGAAHLPGKMCLDSVVVLIEAGEPQRTESDGFVGERALHKKRKLPLVAIARRTACHIKYARLEVLRRE